MANKLSYSIAVNMISDGIKKGAATFRSELQSMQYKLIAFVGALGLGGMGLGGFVSKLMETARETNRANTALKNVSTSSEAFGQNQRWLIELSSKYGIQINALTLNFAKFTAAANSSNMAMSDQKKIFESMSRASVAFSLNAEDTNLAFLAVTQMMSKGKISSEELRRQLGEKIPVAMAAMARATGKPINQLDKLLKAGSLLSAEILPKFADEMTKMLPDVNTDNLETSINRLGNAFVEFTKGTGIQKAYKDTVDGLTKLTQFAGQNITAIFDNVIAVVSAIFLGKGLNAFIAFWAKTKAGLASYVAQSQVANEQVLLATANRVKAEQSLEKAKNAALLASDTERFAANEKIEKAKTALERTQNKERMALEVQKVAAEKASQVTSLTGWGMYWATMKAIAVTAWTAIKGAFMSFLPMAAIYGVTMLIQNLVAAKKKADELRSAMSNYRNDVANAGTNSNAVKDLKNQYEIASNIKGKMSERLLALNALNAMFETNYSINTKTLKIEGDINAKYRERLLLLKQESEFKAIQDKKRQVEDKISETAQGTGLSIDTLQGLVRTYIRTGANKTTESNMPKEFISGIYKAITFDGKVKYNSLETASIFSNVLDAIKTIASQNAIYNQANRDEAGYLAKGIGKNDLGNTIPTALDPEETPLSKAEKEYTDKMRELTNLRALELISVDEYNKERDKQSKETANKIGAILGRDALKNSIFNLAKSGVDNPLTSKTYEEEKKYSDEMARLNSALAARSISQETFNEDVDKLNKETYEKLGGMLGANASGNSVFNLAKSGVDNPLTKTMDKVQKEYADELQKLTKEKEANQIDEATYNVELQKLIETTMGLSASILGADAKTNEFYKSLSSQKAGISLPTLAKRDSTFDYKKNAYDITGEKLDVNKENIDRLKESIGDSADALQKEIENGKSSLAELQAKYSSIAPQFVEALNQAIGEGKSLEDMLKIAEVKKDIKDLSAEISKGMYANFRDIVGSVERIGNNIDAISKAFSDVDSSGWEKIKSIWSFLFDTIDSFTQILENIKNLTELTGMLTKAKETEKVIDAGISAAKITAIGAESAAQVAGVSAVTTALAAETAVAHQLMVVGSTAAYAALPGGVALSAAQIAGFEALIAASSIPKLANGGIAYGNSIVNVGEYAGASSNPEVIAPLDKLKNLIGGGGSSVNVNIGGRIQGSDLYLILKNHMKKTGLKL